MADPQGPWLAIDSATDTAGLALLGPERLIEEAHWTGRRRHTRELAPTLEAMLARQALKAADLAGVAVTLGPGSYTGLRIGLALAKGLALGAELPLVGLPTLDVLAAALAPPQRPSGLPLWAVLQAGRGRVVAARYPSSADAEPGWPDARALEVWTVDQLVEAVEPPAWAAGELSTHTTQRLEAAGLIVLPAAAGLRRAGWLAQLGRQRLVERGPDDPARLAPIYPGGS